MRADARRNRETVLAAARQAFDAHGPDASLDDIARRAGVGPGTLYRHFPKRADLQEAVYRDAVEAIAERGHALAAEHADDPGRALRRWLEEFVAHLATRRGLAGALMETRSKADEPFASCHAVIHDGGDAVLEPARVAGVVGAGVTLSDVLWLANGIALAAEGMLPGPDGEPDPDATARVERLLAIVLAGIRDP